MRGQPDQIPEFGASDTGAGRQFCVPRLRLSRPDRKCRDHHYADKEQRRRGRGGERHHLDGGLSLQRVAAANHLDGDEHGQPREIRRKDR